MNEKQAREHVKELRDYYTHLIIYFTVNFFLFVVDYATGNGWWFYFPLLAWGIGIVAHTISVFGFGHAWEEKKVQELLKKKR